MEPSRTEQTLRESEERYRLIVEGARDYAILTLGLDGRIESWSPGAEAIFGWGEAEALGQPAAMTFTPEDRAAGEHEKEATTALREGTAPDVRWHQRKDGRRVFIHGTMRALYDTHGDVRGFLKIGQDVTERRRAEEALRASEARLRSAFALRTVGVVFWGRGFRLTEVNDAFLHMTGFTREEALGKTWQELTPPAFHAASRRAVEEIATRGETTPYEKQYYRKDGSRWWGLFAARRVDGEVLEFVIDITARREAEALLHESEARFRAVADLVPDLLWQSDLSGARTWGNRRWTEYTGQALEATLGYGWTEAVHPDDRDEALRVYREGMEAGEPFRQENRLRRADGAYRWFRVMAHPVRDAAGTITQWFGAAADVHEQRTALEVLEAHVEERTRQVRELVVHLTRAEQDERRRISQILHDDLQQILFGIRLRTWGIAAALGKKEGLEDVIEETRVVGVWAEQAIDKTRRLSVDLSPPLLKSEGLANALLWLRPQMEDLYGLQVEIEAAHAFRMEDEDLRLLLFQVVRELVFNVRKHAGVDRVTVRLREEDGQVVIEVADEGHGYDAAATEPKKGFGLYSVQERLRLLGGRIEVESHPGAGTRVTVYAPLRPRAPGQDR